MTGNFNQNSLTDTPINNSKLMKCEVWDLFTPVCHQIPASAPTISCQSEAMVWVQPSGLILPCWKGLSKCVHRHTHRALEREEHFLLGQFMETFLYQKLLSYDTLNFTGEQHPSPGWELDFTNNPINSASKSHPNSIKGSNCSTAYATRTAQRYPKRKPWLEVWAVLIPELSLKTWNWSLRTGPCTRQDVWLDRSFFISVNGP